jgi:glycerol dehydrogenase
MSKECESELASRAADIFHTVLLGRALGKVCTEPLLEYGEKALADFKEKKVTYELQQVVLDIIISTGLVSNCTTGHNGVYYYNSSIAHLFYNSSTVLPQVVEGHLHGEIVSFGVLVLLTYDKQFELRDRIAAFYKKAGYPVKLADLDIKADEIDAIVEKAPAITEWNCVPSPLTKEAFKQAIVDTDAFGSAL